MKMFLALKVVCLLIVVSLYVSITTANAENKRNRQMSAVDDAVYDMLVQLTKSSASQAKVCSTKSVLR